MAIFLNWIWQGSALTLLVALVVGRLRAVNAATRERIWWATLAGVCLMPFVPLLGLMPATRAAVATDAALLITVPEPSSLVVGTAWMIWMASVAVSGFRLAIAVIALGRAKRSAAPFPPARLETLTTWARVSSHGRQARLAVSDRVTTAAVLGLGRPVIAVSPDALDRLTDDELEDILVHEYAHVQRFDDLGVLAQRAVGAIFGLHPAVWWLGRALTLEREVACDDLVLAQTRNSPQRYARSLVKLVEQAGRQRRLRLAPGAIVSRHQLTRRIVRLLDRGRNASARPSRSTIGAAAAAIGVILVAMLSVELVAIASSTLASQSIAAGLVQPFERSTGLASDSTVVEGSIVRDTNALEQARGPLPRLGDLPPETTPRVPGTPEPVATETVRRATPDSPTAEPLGVVAIAPLASESPTPATRADAAGGESTPPWAHAPPESPTPWGLAADAGSAIGRGSRAGAIKTAGFFTGIGKSVAGAF
jgi:beta-lactamase regulating signal transducer with metallopeptidase domain